MITYSPKKRNDEVHFSCIFTFALVALLAVFICWLPLGDPEKMCSVVPEKPSEKCLCSFYDNWVTLIKKSKSFGSLCLHTLYRAKLQFYNLLGNVDKNDICQVVDCRDQCGKKGPTASSQRNCCKKRH